MSGQKASKIIKRLGIYQLDQSRSSGGICLLWRNSEFDVDYVYSNPQLLHCLVTKRKTRESVLSAGAIGSPQLLRARARMDTLLHCSIRRCTKSILG